MRTNEEKIKFKYQDELEYILNQYDLDKDDICIVGSFALSIRNIRDHGDIDICLKEDAYNKIKNKLNGNYLSEHVNIIQGKYERLLGISNNSIIADEKYHDQKYGYKVIKLELEFSAKVARNWKKDHDDIPKLEEYAIQSDSWNWSLVNFDYKSKLKSKDRYLEKLNKIIYLVKRVAKNPRLILKKVAKIVSVSRFNSRPSSNLQSQLVTKIPTAALLGNQFLDGEFSRYDVILRYLTIKSIIEGDGQFEKFYTYMQDQRVQRDTLNQMTKLIESMKVNGFQLKYPILVNGSGFIIDGSHRLAAALYFGIEEVPIKIESNKKRIYYGRKWFEEVGFDRKIIELMEVTKERLFKETGVWFTVILWPPVKLYFEEIKQLINLKYTIKWEKELKLDNLDDFMRKVYAIDDIDRWKVEKKIEFMKNFDGSVYVLALEIPNPEFRLKKRTTSYLSDVGASLKKEIRDKFQKKIDNYFYDIICHMGDNHEHNKKMFMIIDDNSDE